jgi:Transglycosylase SLT domain
MRSIFGCTALCLGLSAAYIIVLVPPPIHTPSSRRLAVAGSPFPPVEERQASTDPVEERQASTDPVEEPNEAEDARKPAPTREEICNSVAAAAQAHDLPISFLASLVWQESRFNSQAVSPVGAVGIAQFMPPVATAFGVADPFDALKAIPASAKLLRELHEQFGNLGLAAAAYNAGPKRVLDWMASRGNLPGETRTYVLNITGRPAEQWVTKIDNTAFKIPARTPCQSFASLQEWSLAGTGELKPDLPDVVADAQAKKPMIAASRNNMIEMGAKPGTQPKTKVITAQPRSIPANLRGKAAGKPPLRLVPAQRTAVAGS